MGAGFAIVIPDSGSAADAPMPAAARPFMIGDPVIGV